MRVLVLLGYSYVVQRWEKSLLLTDFSFPNGVYLSPEKVLVDPQSKGCT